MAKKLRKLEDTQPGEIELMRGGKIVSTITGAFGQPLRETRLTAMLGYLIALRSGDFLALFGFPGTAQSVSLETSHDAGRSDILVATTKGVGIIEAKIGAIDPFEQSKRYGANWVALLTNRGLRAKRIRGAKYITWDQIAAVLEKLSHLNSAEVRVLSRDLIKYLQEHRMIRGRKVVEIYAREINEPVTLKLLLEANLYACRYEASSLLPEALYFAPHFGASISKDHTGINVGISYVARIDFVGYATTWAEFVDLTRTRRGAAWLRRNRELLRQLKQKWFVKSKDQHRSFLFLDKPRLVFNPPIQKQRLQRGKGWLSKRFFTFDELFAAWQRRTD
jgi:hypothetical protein